MRKPDPAPTLTAAQAAALFTDPAYAAKYPPLLSPDQAADLLQVPKQTVYSWSSQGMLDGCKAKAGRHLRLFRDRLLVALYEGKLHGGK